MKAGKPDLPKSVGVWNRLESPRIINSKNIFKYMNGAGELYLGYRFRHLEVFDYTSADQGNILVELVFHGNLRRCIWLAFPGLGR